MNSIKNKDMDTLSTYVHPSKGLRFTPYTYIDMENDQLFTAEEVLGLNGDSTLYIWGAYDVTGFEPEYEGIDWKSLTLVFEKDSGDCYLVGIIHGQWTI